MWQATGVAAGRVRALHGDIFLLRWLKHRLQAEPSAPRAGGSLPADPAAKTPSQAKFKLEALEPRLLLSGDSPLLADAYRAMVADEANAASLPQDNHFQQLDAATRDEISAARQGAVPCRP